jgi:hypothetical protein
LKEQFDRAKAANNRVNPRGERTRRGHAAGAPRHDPAAVHQPRPKGREAEAVDRKTFEERQAKLARAEAAMQRVAPHKATGREHDRGRGR